MPVEVIVAAVSASITTAGTVVAAWLGLRAKLAMLTRKVDSVDVQVNNSHGPDTNLRDDIDKTHALVLEVRDDLLEMKDQATETAARTRALEARFTENDHESNRTHVLILERIAQLASDREKKNDD